MLRWAVLCWAWCDSACCAAAVCPHWLQPEVGDLRPVRWRLGRGRCGRLAGPQLRPLGRSRGGIGDLNVDVVGLAKDGPARRRVELHLERQAMSRVAPHGEDALVLGALPAVTPDFELEAVRLELAVDQPRGLDVVGGLEGKRVAHRVADARASSSGGRPGLRVISRASLAAKRSGGFRLSASLPGARPPQGSCAAIRWMSGVRPLLP